MGPAALHGLRAEAWASRCGDRARRFVGNGVLSDGESCAGAGCASCAILSGSIQNFCCSKGYVGSETRCTEPGAWSFDQSTLTPSVQSRPRVSSAQRNAETFSRG